ncbi:hypothetical protein PCAR4_350214 [Paraburkholderia caribensis]|nr:hypothetical protein PCAR4_350214 [Paraburkholderia caribensis]
MQNRRHGFESCGASTSFKFSTSPSLWFLSEFFAAAPSLVGDHIDSLLPYFLYKSQAGSVLPGTYGLKKVYAQVFQLAFSLFLGSRSVVCNQDFKQSQHDSVPCA